MTRTHTHPLQTFVYEFTEDTLVRNVVVILSNECKNEMNLKAVSDIYRYVNI